MLEMPSSSSLTLPHLKLPTLSTPLSHLILNPPSHLNMVELHIISHFTLLLLTLLPPTTTSVDVTSILSQYPDLSTFTSLLTTTGIASTLTSRASLTILAVPNSRLHSLSSPSLPDSLRYHVLLQYLTLPSLRQSPPSGTLLPTLLTTVTSPPSSRPSSSSLNATFNPSTGAISLSLPSNSSISTHVVSSVAQSKSLSILTVDSLLSPPPLNLMASEAHPSASPPPPLNITQALLNGHDFNVATSMLVASGVVSDFQDDEGGAGITLFVPTDLAFANLPPSVHLQSLSADKKSLILKFHVLHSYYPLGSLESIVNPVQPTLATEDNGAGSFTLNISKINGSVAINTGVVQGVVTQTVFDQNPVAIFGVSKVLLPREMFGSGSGSKDVDLGKRGDGPLMAQAPEVGAAPENEPDGYDGPKHLSSPPGMASGGGREWRRGHLGMFLFLVLLCV